MALLSDLDAQFRVNLSAVIAVEDGPRHAAQEFLYLRDAAPNIERRVKLGNDFLTAQREDWVGRDAVNEVVCSALKLDAPRRRVGMDTQRFVQLLAVAAAFDVHWSYNVPSMVIV